MEKDSICLYDSDSLYGRMILQAIQEEGILPGNYTYYSELPSLCEHISENSNSILLLEKEREEEFYKLLKETDISDIRHKEIQSQTLLLADTPLETTDNVIYKYLPRSQFIKQLASWSQSHGGRGRNKSPQKAGQRQGQKFTGYVSFAGTGLEYYLDRLKKEYPEEKRLVVNLELFPCSNPHERPKRNLSDLIYYASIDRLSKITFMDCIYCLDGVDYIEPVTHYKDGYELDENVAELLLTYLQLQSYDHILLVTDCRYRGASRLLELCHEVEIEKTDNPILKKKYDTMVQMLHLEQREPLLNKIKEVNYG